VATNVVSHAVAIAHPPICGDHNDIFYVDAVLVYTLHYTGLHRTSREAIACACACAWLAYED